MIKENRRPASVFLGLGSNLGDRLANLREAVRRIEAAGARIVRESSIYETEPVGYLDQPWFLNQVIEARVERDGSLQKEGEAEALLAVLLHIEEEMGRRRVIEGGPRVIDIDLLLYGGLIIARSTGVIIPHPRMHLRRFVLEPMCEIAPRLMHPSIGKTVRELLDELDDPSIVRPYAERDD
jgi:2-amino-4-hydroxy-6-hydroxymethyldihydropteridine diphosphokinase